jgi:hypothetical protein
MLRITQKKKLIFQLWNSLFDVVILLLGNPEAILACILRYYSIESIGQAERFWV